MLKNADDVAATLRKQANYSPPDSQVHPHRSEHQAVRTIHGREVSTQNPFQSSL